MKKEIEHAYWLLSKSRWKTAILYYGGKCIQCGFDDHLSGLTFHHRDPKLKEAQPGALLASRKRMKIVYEELDKCDLLCMNCHIETHSHGTKDWKTRDYAAENLICMEENKKPDQIHRSQIVYKFIHIDGRTAEGTQHYMRTTHGLGAGISPLVNRKRHEYQGWQLG